MCKGPHKPVCVSAGVTVEHVKERMRVERSIPVTRQQLEYRGEELYSRRSLEEAVPRGASVYLRGNSVHRLGPLEPSSGMKQAVL